MTFLNWSILLALSAMAIPIVIHLLNRSRAKVVDWGAMRFLTASLAARSRRIMVEELVLLVLRCLVVALAVLAVARPFLPTRPTLMLAVLIPAVPAGAVCAAVAGAMWSRKVLRLRLLVAAALLLVIPLAGGAYEQWYQASRWNFGGGSKDVAIVIDGSMSMTLSDGAGETNFDRAVREARAVVNSCGSGDGISLVLAGGSPRAIISSPTSKHNDVVAALDELEPTGGSMRAARVLRLALGTLVGGANPAKKIILITDGQQVGWDVRNKSPWRMLGAAISRQPTTADVIVRTLPAPRRLANVALAGITLGRGVIGTDREVSIDVRVSSTGTDPVSDVAVSLLVDGVQVGTKGVSRVPVGADEVVRFTHRFAKPGRHVLTARIEAQDALEGDNIASRVVSVRSGLGVLIIDGSPSPRPLSGAGDFLAIALSPPLAPTGEAGATPAVGGGSLLATTVVAAPDVAKLTDLDDYAVVVLADVSLLGSSLAGKLAAFVAGGGGLLIAPGPQCRPEFYNAWRDAAGRQIVPARLGQLKSVVESPARLSPSTFSHQALARIAADPACDAGRATFTSYWKLQLDPGDRDAGVGGRLDTSDPMLVERKCGKGVVLMLAGPLDVRSTNLPILNCFVPLMHEMVCYLAEPGLAEPNVRLGQDVMIELAGAEKLLKKGGKLEVVLPSGARRWATVTSVQGRARVRLSRADEPGLYRMLLPDTVAKSCPAMSPDGKGVPFAVLDDGSESVMAMLTDADLQIARKHMRKAPGREGSRAGKLLFCVETTGELLAAVSGGIPGWELWRILAVALVVALLAEVGLTRWIACQRRVSPGRASRACLPVGRFGDADDATSSRARDRAIFAPSAGHVPRTPKE